MPPPSERELPLPRSCGRPQTRIGPGFRLRTPEVSRRLSGHADVQPEVPEPELEQAPAGQVHYPGQQDDDKDDQDNPDKDDHKARERKPAYSCHSRNASRCAGISGRPGE